MSSILSSTRNIFSGSLFFPFLVRKVYQPSRFFPLNNDFVFFSAGEDLFLLSSWASAHTKRRRHPAVSKIFMSILYLIINHHSILFQFFYFCLCIILCGKQQRFVVCPYQRHIPYRTPDVQTTFCSLYCFEVSLP